MKTDEQIQNDVTAELQWEPLLSNSNIRVAVLHGRVTLFGHTPNYSAKLTARQAASRVKGVREIVNSIEVLLSPVDGVPDQVLTKNILNTLSWHTSVPDGGIHLKVKKGLVTLSGELEFQYQKEAALTAIRHLQGIRDITDLITIQSKPDSSVIADDIRKTLERRADLEASGIKVEVIGNKVILKGVAHSWEERTASAHAAWSAPGVDMVDDQIVIEYD